MLWLPSDQRRPHGYQSTLDKGSATEPWASGAAAAREVDGAGGSASGSSLSGKKGTLPSSKLAMVVSTQLVWAAGTKQVSEGAAAPGRARPCCQDEDW